MTVDKSERGKPGGSERLFAAHDGARGSRGAAPGTGVTAAASWAGQQLNVTSRGPR